MGLDNATANGLAELLVVGNLGRSLGAEIKGINIQAR
jgi:Tfp pilus assembly protein FimV